jgi:hypothetical protein
MSKLVFKAHAGYRLHCEAGDEKRPIIFDRDGLYETENPQEIKVLERSKKVTLVSENEENLEKNESKKTEKSDKKKNDKNDKSSKKDEKKQNFHTITKEDLEENPDLKKKYKVGDTVDMDDM